MILRKKGIASYAMIICIQISQTMQSADVSTKKQDLADISIKKQFFIRKWVYLWDNLKVKPDKEKLKKLLAETHPPLFQTLKKFNMADISDAEINEARIYLKRYGWLYKVSEYTSGTNFPGALLLLLRPWDLISWLLPEKKISTSLALRDVTTRKDAIKYHTTIYQDIDKALVYIEKDPDLGNEKNLKRVNYWRSILFSALSNIEQHIRKFTTITNIKIKPSKILGEQDFFYTWQGISTLKEALIYYQKLIAQLKNYNDKKSI
jgi:hypothetical protein